MQRDSTYIRSWASLLIAILAWIAAGYFLMTVLQMQSEREAYLADAAAANIQEGQAAQLRVAARETEADRATLDRIANTDVLVAVNAIESVNASGTVARVTSAQPVKANPKAGTQLNIVDLSVHADGPFSSLMHIVQLLETLPFATSVQELDLSTVQADKTQKNTSNAWSLNMRLRFYTSATLST